MMTYDTEVANAVSLMGNNIITEYLFFVRIVERKQKIIDLWKIN
jgi:hypothetical protein